MPFRMLNLSLDKNNVVTLFQIVPCYFHYNAKIICVLEKDFSYADNGKKLK